MFSHCNLNRMTIKFSKYLIYIFLCIGLYSAGQTSSELDIYFNVRGSVYYENSYEPIPNAAININGGRYAMTDSDGSFKIRVKEGDRLTVSHESFKTVEYTIIDNDRIVIKVTKENNNYSGRRKTSKFKNARFNQLIDSADTYLKQDAEKAIKFIGDALDVNTSVKQSAEAHELLGDIYMYWKQYDLAVSAYKISLQNFKVDKVSIKLAQAFYKNGNTNKSILTYNTIVADNLTNYEKIEYYEGLADTYLLNKSADKAVVNYEKGLNVAESNAIQPKITDLYIKLAKAYNTQGDKVKANFYFNRALNLAEDEDKKRAIETQITIAEFNNSNADYTNEINIRKKVLKDIEDTQLDTLMTNANALTPQKQNYKIGNAYLLNNDVDNAVSYFEKSIEEAEKREDLVVEKDALRKLSEAQFSVGDTDKAIATINRFKSVVDELYVKKEQEISRAARFSKNIAEQQNRITSLESDRALSQSKYELTEERNKRQQLIIYSLIGGLLLLLITGYFMYTSIRQQKLANNLLALKSLRSQMNPHFIFNALNSVNSFIATSDERTANRYLADFSYLMRAVLENSEEVFIPLKKEIEQIKLYVKLEHFRFQDKFDYTFNIDESIDIEAYKIPPMLLQPYIENAVWHGLRYKETKGELHISIQKQSKHQITIRICDNGIGRERSKALKTGNQKKQNSKGMDNIKKRVTILNDMYKDKVDVDIQDYQEANDTGTQVIITLKKD